MTRPILFLAALALPLAACDRSGQGTTITINADDGNVLGGVDGNSGEVKLDVPGFSGKITLPKLQLNAGDFDLNGVHLYPGSTIETMNVAGGDKKNDVRVAFTSPATPDTVRAWFQERLAKVGFTIKPDGTGLSGTTDEDKPFKLTLTPDGGKNAKGEITLGS